MVPKQRTSRKNYLLPALCLFVITGLAYLPVLSAGFIWDDDSMLNSFVKATNGLRYIWFSTELPDYFPLTSTTLWIEHRLWGDRPMGYHVVNVLLHCAGVIGLWRVFSRLQIPGALCAAALFAVHPVTVDSVAWITERKNILSFFFFVFSVLFYLKWNNRRDKPENINSPRYYVFSLLFFLFALLSKTAVVGLPFVLLLCLAWQGRDRQKVGDLQWSGLNLRRLRPLIPFFGLALLLGLVTVWFQYNRAIGEDFIHDKPFALRVATAGWAIWFYLFKAIWPVQLSFVYPEWNPTLNSIVAWLPLTAIIATFLFLWLRRKACFIARAVLYALSYFVLMLLPVLGFLKIYFHRYSPVADHWQYFSLPAITALIAAAIFYPWKRSAVSADRMRLGVAALLIVVSASLTWRHCGVYRSAEKLWLDTLAKNPGAWLAHNNLGLLLDAQGKTVDAVSHYSKSLALQPRQVEAHNNLGSALLNQGKLDEAIAEFQVALKINPRSAVTLYNIGNALDQKGQRDDAVVFYRQALSINPNYVNAHNNLGCILALTGDAQQAIQHFQEALRLDPDDANVLNNLGSTLVEQGKAVDAMPLLKKAVELYPGYADAHFNLGNAVFAVGDLALAGEHYARAAELNPQMPMARYRLGNVLLQLKRTDEALAQYQAAVQLQPELAEAHYQIGTILMAQQEISKGIEHLKEAVRLKPDWVEALNNLAWILATNDGADVRDGAEALKLARRAMELTGANQPGVLDTLAAAYAETGDFEKAITVGEQALSKAEPLPGAFKEQLRQRLAGYRSRRPFRE